MSMNILNDISSVYVNQILEKKDDSYLEVDMQKRRKNNETAVKDMKKSKSYKDMVNTINKQFEALDPPGKEDSDIDNDGTPNDENDKYIRRKRLAISKAMSSRKKEKKVTSESFSNWRQDLIEIIDTDKTNTKIKEKKVDNYSGKDKCVNLNPQIDEQISIVEELELDEKYIFDTANNAAKYFYEEGLNEDGVDILIEELGLDEFVSFVFEINNEVLTEARAGGVKIEPKTKGGKDIASLKGGARTSAINRLRKEKQARKETEEKASSEKPSGLKASLQRQSAVANAKKQQPKKKGVLDRIAGAVLKGMERHKVATSTASNLASQTAKTVLKAAKVGAKSASEIGKGVASGVSSAATTAKKVKKAVVGESKKMKGEDPCWKGYEMVGTKKKNGKEVPNCVPKEEIELDEKITSKTSKEKIISDFVRSDDPRFEGSTKKERIKRALGAWYSMHKSKSRKVTTEETDDSMTNTTDQKPNSQQQSMQQQANKQNKIIDQQRKKIQAQKIKDLTTRLSAARKGIY